MSKKDNSFGASFRGHGIDIEQAFPKAESFKLVKSIIYAAKFELPGKLL
jgi:hypothetical protein